VACAVALTASASTALAADLLPTKKGPPPAPVAAPYSWTGFNVGVQGGYGWGDENDNLSAYRVPADHFSANGAIGGAHVGYDQQFGSLVLGVRGEIDASGLSGSATAFIPNSPSVCFEGCSVSFRNTWQAFLLGRAGVAFDRLLVYAVGGLAVGDDRESVTTNIFEGTPGTASQTKTLYGGAIGLGAEYAFDEHWRLGAEWRYASFGKGDYSAALYEAVHAVPYKAGFSENLALVDLSYRF
jgi:outer membrane immunogenic protein